MLHTVYLAGLCSRRSWSEPIYRTSPTRQGYVCRVRVNNREYQTSKSYESETAAKEAAALTAYTICRSFSVNDGMYPTGFDQSGVIQGTPVPVGSGRSRPRNPMEPSPGYHYRGDSDGSSRSGGSSPDYGHGVRTMNMRRPAPVSNPYTTIRRYDPQYVPHLNQKGVDEALADFDDHVVESQEKQNRAPWHREGVDRPPVDKQRSSSAMTMGKLLTTPSRLLKLVLPLTTIDKDSDKKDVAPLALLVHPQQPLSYLERLVQSELPSITTEKGENRVPAISFRAMESDDDSVEPKKKSGSDEPQHRDKSSGEILGEGAVEGYSGDGREGDGKDTGKFVRWSASTEIGDFIRDAARAKEFEVEIEGFPEAIKIAVPSFNDRTFYLRQRLRRTSNSIAGMAKIKKECDVAAHKSGQRLAMSGCAIMVGYWYVVYRLTFETDLGWDVMEPVTYLVGLSTLIGGYMWFLYHNREVSYRSALNLTVSRRQSRLYEAKGFDLQKWEQLIEEGNAIRKEIKAVAAEYDVEYDEKADEKDESVVKALRKERKEQKRGSKDKDKDDDDDDDN